MRVLVDAIGTCNAKAEKRALRNMRAKGAKLSDTETLMNSSAVRLLRKQSLIDKYKPFIHNPLQTGHTDNKSDASISKE